MPEHSSAITRRRPLSAACAFLVTIFGVAGVLRAQDNYEIQVYGADLVPKGHTMVELHSNFTFLGSTTSADGVRPTQHALHETLEITRGFADVFKVGFYTFTSTTPGVGPEWVGTHIRPRFAAPARWQWPVGVSISQEFGYVRRIFSADTWSWEIRPIIDQKAGPLYWSVNPALERSLQGPATRDGFVFAPNAEVAWDLTPKIQAAIEYYGSFGSLQHFAAISQTTQQLFPAINLDLGPEWEFNLGVGPGGLTAATDRMLVKLILGRRI